MKTGLVLIADGSEEIESVGVIDTLRRAEFNVTVASVGDQLQVKCSRGVVIVADELFANCVDKEFDVIVLPGGKQGAETFRDSPKVIEKIRNQLTSSKYLAAICASPALVLAHHELINDRKATSYPTFWKNIQNLSKERVVTDGNLITSQGPATTLEFAGEIIRQLCGEEAAKKTLDPMLV